MSAMNSFLVEKPKIFLKILLSIGVVDVITRPSTFTVFPRVH